MAAPTNSTCQPTPNNTPRQIMYPYRNQHMMMQIPSGAAAAPQYQASQKPYSMKQQSSQEYYSIQAQGDPRNLFTHQYQPPCFPSIAMPMTAAPQPAMWGAAVPIQGMQRSQTAPYTQQPSSADTSNSTPTDIINTTESTLSEKRKAAIERERKRNRMNAAQQRVKQKKALEDLNTELYRARIEVQRLKIELDEVKALIAFHENRTVSENKQQEGDDLRRN